MVAIVWHEKCAQASVFCALRFDWLPLFGCAVLWDLVLVFRSFLVLRVVSRTALSPFAATCRRSLP
jgi:hypothetical protein